MSRPGDWNCRGCNHLNFQRRESCQRCGEPRIGGGDFGGIFGGGRLGGGGGSSSSSPFSFMSSTGPDVRPGDWYCTLGVGNCGAHNFASRSSCFKCGAPKEDYSSGSGSAEMMSSTTTTTRPFSNFGSTTRPAGWKSGDWICTRSGCNEHNFANRMECYRCNAPREYSSTTTTANARFATGV